MIVDTCIEDLFLVDFEYDDLWDHICSLCYTQHEGSGYTLTLENVLDLTFDRFNFMIEWLRNTRRAESDAIKRASRRR